MQLEGLLINIFALLRNNYPWVQWTRLLSRLTAREKASLVSSCLPNLAMQQFFITCIIQLKLAHIKVHHSVLLKVKLQMMTHLTHVVAAPWHDSTPKAWPAGNNLHVFAIFAKQSHRCCFCFRSGCCNYDALDLHQPRNTACLSKLCFISVQ